MITLIVISLMAQVIFIVFKLVGIVGWTWEIVFTPSFINIGLLGLAFGLEVVATVIEGINNRRS